MAASIIAPVNYVDATAGRNNALTFDQRQPGPGASELIQGGDRQHVTISDGRTMAEHFSLDCQGFEFITPEFDLSTLTPLLASLDQNVSAEPRDEWIRQHFYPELETYLATRFGASRVFTFDHTIRANTSSQAEKSTRRRAPVKTVHNDYTPFSAQRQLQQTLQEQGIDGEPFSRYQFINLWMPVLHKVEESPLGMIDLRTASADDFHYLRVIYPHRVGQISAISANPNHRWIWFSDMQPGEALLLRVFDSRHQGGITGVPHSAFDLPGQAAQRQRTSLEIRTIALYE